MANNPPGMPAQPPRVQYSTPPGWYPDTHGQLRWWDGYAWGVAAAQAPTATQALTDTQASTAHYSQSAVSHTGPKAKPALSKLSIAAAALTVMTWLFWLLDTFTPRPVAERCQTQECWDALADGSLDLTPGLGFAQFLGRLVMPMLFVAIGLAIAGLVRSSRRPLPLVALLLPCMTILLMLIPMILMLFGLTLYGVMGASGAFG